MADEFGFRFGCGVLDGVTADEIDALASDRVRFAALPGNESLTIDA